MSRTTILSNVVRALASEGTLERDGRVIEGIATQLQDAGVRVTARDLRDALDAAVEACPDVPGTLPAVSLHYGTWGREYRLRPAPEVRDAIRACIDAVYRVTDLLPRVEEKLPNGLVVETIRPRAFARALGRLRVRWARGILTVPSPAVISRWVRD